MKDFGEEMKRRRTAVGMSLTGLAAAVHFTKGYLAKVENGKVRVNRELAKAVDQALDAGGELLSLVTEHRVPRRSPTFALHERFAYELRHLRTTMGLSQEEFASRIHFSSTVISAIETQSLLPRRTLAEAIDREFATDHRFMSLMELFDVNEGQATRERTQNEAASDLQGDLTTAALQLIEPQFPSTEKIALSEEELAIETVGEFRRLLRLVLERAALTCGQVATKTSIGRSSAYNLVNVERTGLPTKPLQVQEFLCACGLQFDQISAIMRSWVALNTDRPKPTGKPATPAPAPAPTSITKLSPTEILRETSGRRGPKVRDFAISSIAREIVRPRTMLINISLVIGVLIGLRMLAHSLTLPSWLDLFASWPVLALLALAITARVLRWQLRRRAAPKPRPPIQVRRTYTTDETGAVMFSERRVRG